MTGAMVQHLKDTEQDFEWYPTTETMVETVWRHINGRSHNGFSMLDIGAGDGRVFSLMDDMSAKHERGATLSDRYAIEKATPLIKAMPDNVCIVGTDFDTNTLIDKQVGVIFCNPPYSVFERWAEKIVKEANAPHVYLILPRRWTESKALQKAIERREAMVKVLASSDFKNADRKARAVVDIIHLDMRDPSYNWAAGDHPNVDPFDLWFSEHFDIPVAEDDAKEHKDGRAKQERRDKLAQGRNQVEVLNELYQQDLAHLLHNYQAVGELDPDILRELEVSVPGVRTALRGKIGGLKHLYWHELFDKLSSLTNRLTADTRERMTTKLNGHANVDFSVENAYAVVIWALKNANRYIDSQLLDLYKRLSSKENIRGYKSNSHFEEDTWRYGRHDDFWKDHHHYALEYRLVLEGYSAIKKAGDYDFDYPQGLSTNAHGYLGDIFVIARNLGYDVINDTHCRQWESNQSEEFLYMNEGDIELFAEVRAFKNGNIHIKACQGFIRALNIEAARLNGWVKSARDAAEKLCLPVHIAEKHFACNIQFTSMPLLQEAT